MRARFVVASRVAGEVTVFDVDGPAAAEELVVAGRCAVGGDLAAVAVDPDATTVHVSARSAPEVVSLRLCPDGSMHELTRIPVPDRLVALCVTTDGRYLVGTAYESDAVLTLALDDDGGAVGVVDRALPGPHPHCVLADPGRGSVWVAVLGHDVVLRVPVSVDGTLGLAGADRLALPAGFGPRHLALAPARDELTVLGEQSGLLARIALREPEVLGIWSSGPREWGMAPGVIREPRVEVPHASADGRPLVWSADVDVNARFVYATERTSSRLSVTEPATGRIVQCLAAPTQPRALALDPTGRWLLVGGELADEVVLHRVDPDDGTLTPVASAPVPDGAIWCSAVGAHRGR